LKWKKNLNKTLLARQKVFVLVFVNDFVKEKSRLTNIKNDTVFGEFLYWLFSKSKQSSKVFIKLLDIKCNEKNF
jgi:hypothetical protein